MSNEYFHYSHGVAVNAYLMRQNLFLFLKRNKDPKIWGPPGGRLGKVEDPISGLMREIKEETNLEVEILAPVNTWFGKWREETFISIDYLAISRGGNLKLSGEHSEAIWVSIKDIKEGRKIQLHPHLGFKIEHFIYAAKLHSFLEKLR